MSDDPKLSQRYRELPPEEPPRHLDDAILAASRRAVESRPAPLVAPSDRRRWYVPLAAAAVIVLAVAVTVHIESEQPYPELVMTEPAPKAAEAPRIAEQKAPQRPSFAPDPQRAPAERRELRRERDALARQEAAARPAPAAAPVPAAEQGARADNEAAQRQRAAGAASMLAKVEQSPEQALQGIAELRRRGRHEEADKALAEFRKRYPDYRLSDEMKAKVERSQ